MLTSTDGLEQEQSGDTDQDSPGIHQGGLAACAKTQCSEFRERPLPEPDLDLPVCLVCKSTRKKGNNNLNMPGEGC